MTFVILQTGLFDDTMVMRKMFITAMACLLTTASVLVAATPAWTTEDKEIWKKAIKRVVTTPPCCGACSVVSMQEGRQIYKFIIGEDTSQEAEKAYKEHEKRLQDAFGYFSPSRYHYWFGKDQKGDQKP